MSHEQRKLAAIVAADVVGYSRLMGRDESGTLVALKALRQEIVDPAIASYGGRIVKTTGDGLLLEFPSVVNSVRCAVEVQTAMAERTVGMADDTRIAFRVGINLGDIIVEGDDIFGDAVNVAARLQEVSEPGGICLSNRVHKDVRDRLDALFVDGGVQMLKNISRPVQVWHWRSDAVVAGPIPSPAVLPLPEKPSIAVLPFQNMSDNSEQEYFVDGLVEDIITGLSRFKSLFVIARNSSFAYKSKSPDVRQVGRELGVRYVLEGSVRKAGNRVRITGQLIDAADSTHLWADRFDGALEDVFDLQDMVTTNVVGVIAPRVEQAEIERTRGKPAGSLRAYDLLLRAQALMRTPGRKGIEDAMTLLRRAVDLDPTYARALANLSLCCWIFISQGFGHRDDPLVADIVHAAQKGLALAPSDSEVVVVAARAVGLPGGDLEAGVGLIEKAIVLNPNNAEAFRLGAVLYGYLGQVEKAVEYQKRGDRLNPLYGGWNGSIGYVLAYFSAGAHEKVLEWTAQILSERPNAAGPLRYRAASLALVGRVQEARQIIARILEQTPDYSVTEVRRHHEFDMNNPFKLPGVAEALYRGLHMAGLPE